MKKFILIPILLLFMTGCSVDYTIEIDDNNLKESIKLNTVGLSTEDLTSLEDYLYNGAISVSGIQLEIPYYEVIKYNNYYEMNYAYKKGEIELSTLMNTCFNNFKTEETENYYMFVLSGGFECLYKNEEINVTLKTNNKVSKHNSEDFNEESGIYRWRLDSTNAKYADIRFIVIKNEANNFKNTSSNLIKNILIISSIIIIIIVGALLLKKIFSILNKIDF